MRRALGRRIDPETKEVFHMDSKLPDADLPFKVSALSLQDLFTHEVLITQNSISAFLLFIEIHINSALLFI